MQASTVTIVHRALPGRLRLRVPAIHHDPKGARALAAALSRSPVVYSAEASSWTGNLLVRHGPGLDAEGVQALVEEALAGRLQPATPVTPAETAPAPEDLPWHVVPAEAVLERFAVSPASGLDTAVARRALVAYGPNALLRRPPEGGVKILLRQFASLPVALLLGSVGISVVTGGLIDAAAILAVVLTNAGIGFAIERSAQQTIEALSVSEGPPALLLRDGTRREVPAEEVVPGDVMLLEPGMLVGADGRIVESNDLSLDESSLTGESLTVAKSPAVLARADAPLAERGNQVFRGTSVTGGDGIAVATATGYRTEIGRIFALASGATPPPTVMQVQLERTSRMLVFVSLGLCGVVLGLGLLRGQRLLDLVKSTTSLAVAAVPEGMPTVAVVSLAMGIRKMKRHQAVVRQLGTVENLGAVEVLCLDKTGTITQNRMSVAGTALGAGAFRSAREWALSEERDAIAERLLEACVLCSDAALAPDGEGVEGSATETALVRFALERGIEGGALRARHPVREVVHRTEQRKYMLSQHAGPDGDSRLAGKGSPEQLVALCAGILDAGGARALDEATRASILAENDALASRGYRVLGVADGAGAADRLTWLGLIALEDPVRPGLADLMDRFHRAGVRTTMITGDQSATAIAVAREIGLAGEETIEVLDGGAIDRIEPELLAALAAKTHVFARVSPSHKLQIVQALQSTGQVVAMTGDGINDSPALRRADIGIAMGKGGTPAAHEAADLILGNDRLDTLLVAIAEGRTIYDNIRKALHFLLSTNLSEILFTVATTAFGLARPLGPTQLLWINLITDVFPSLALSQEPPAADVLTRPPRKRDEPIIGGDIYGTIAAEGGLISISAIASHLLANRFAVGPRSDNGAAFVNLILTQLFHALTARSQRSVLGGDPFGGNRSLMLALGGLLAAQGGAMSLPLARRALGIGTLGLRDLGIAGGTALATFGAIETAKILRPPKADVADTPPYGRT